MMKTKIIKPLLAIACLLSSFSASAYDFEVDGIYYDVVSLSDLTCKVVSGDNSYKGNIVIPANVNYTNKTWTVVEIENIAFVKCSELTGITIPNTITFISYKTFLDCINLEQVKITDGEAALEFEHYDEYGEIIKAFDNCPIKSLYIGRNLLYESESFAASPFESKYIEDLTIGNSVTEIGKSAFEGCSGLTSVTIGNSVTNIGSWAFCNCSGLTNVIIPNSVTNIDIWAFEGCSGLTNVIIPNSVTNIGVGAFRGCSGLTNVTIPNSVTNIGYDAFYYCSGLTSVTIGNSVTNIGECTFYGCSRLTSVTIPNSVTDIGSSAFYGCSRLKSITIPNSVTTIGDGTFKKCSRLTNVTIPNSVTNIGYDAFYGCSRLTSITIPNSVTNIGEYTFYGCSSLTSVTIGKSVTNIDEAAFKGCSELTELYLYGITPPEIPDGNFTNKQYTTLNVYVPQEALEAYQDAYIWENFRNLQGFDATGIKGIDIDGKDTKGRCFDLRGNRLDAPKSGVNIINGRKVMVK